MPHMMHLVQVDREERQEERFTITSILARRIAMGWDRHNWHFIDDHIHDYDIVDRPTKTDDLCYQLRRHKGGGGGLCQHQFQVLNQHHCHYHRNRPYNNEYAEEEKKIIIVTITAGEILTIRQSFGADDRAELTITTIWFGRSSTMLFHCLFFVPIAIVYHFNPIWCWGKKHILWLVFHPLPQLVTKSPDLLIRKG